MDIVTDSYENISINQLYAKISQKQAQINSIEQKEKIENVKNKDYIELSTVPNNYDEKDFQRVLEKFKSQDIKTRSHEQAHATIGHTTSPISYNYQKGPDGKM
jgi:hypothetical protein